MKKSLFVILFTLISVHFLFAAQFKYKNIIYEQIDDELTLVKYEGKDYSLTLPKKLNKMAITKIGPKAFEGNSTLMEVVIPSSVIYIGEEAFANCSNLEIVVYWSDEIEIGKNAFLNCQDIEFMSSSIAPLFVPLTEQQINEIKQWEIEEAAAAAAEMRKIQEAAPAPVVKANPVDPMIETKRDELLELTLNYARLLEKANDFYDKSTDELPLSYISDIYECMEDFGKSYNSFLNAVSYKYGTQETAKAPPAHRKEWFPDEELKELLSYLSRIDRVLMNMGLAKPADSMEDYLRIQYKYYD